MKACKYCSERIQEGAQFCEHCGKPTKNKARIVWLVLILMIIWIGGGIWNYWQTPPPQPLEADSEYAYPKSALFAKDGLALLRATGTTESISGVVGNFRAQPCSYAAIWFDLYDHKGGARVGSAWTNIINLRSGEQWRFDIHTDFYGYADPSNLVCR